MLIIMLYLIVRTHTSKTVKRRTLKMYVLFDNKQNTKYFEGEDDTTMTKMRAKYVAARLVEARPEYETTEELARRAGFPYNVSIASLSRRKDIYVGLLYQICKVFGYQIIVYNPHPPQGLEKMYVIGDEEAPVTPREKKNKVHYSRDAYNNKLFRTKRKYKRQKGFVKVK